MEKDIVTKSDFLSWREQRITEMFLESVIERIQMLAGELVQNAGIDPLRDRFQSGRVSGLSELADWQPSFIQDE